MHHNPCVHSLTDKSKSYGTAPSPHTELAARTAKHKHSKRHVTCDLFFSAHPGGFVRGTAGTGTRGRHAHSLPVGGAPHAMHGARSRMGPPQRSPGPLRPPFHHSAYARAPCCTFCMPTNSPCCGPLHTNATSEQQGLQHKASTQDTHKTVLAKSFFKTCDLATPLCLLRARGHIQMRREARWPAVPSLRNAVQYCTRRCLQQFLS